MNDKIDFSKLLGFESVSDRVSGGVDFSDDTVGAKLGAKISSEVNEPARTGAHQARG